MQKASSLRKHTICGAALISLVALSSVALHQHSAADDLTIVVNGKEFELVQRGAVRYAAVWRFQPLEDKIIFVCWENPSEPLRPKMELVQAAVTASWQDHSQLEFLGWQKCSPTSPGIRIFIEDGQPHTKGLGRELDGVVDGMVLNFTFNLWKPACQSGTKDEWITDVAVHEFGHAIGFTHEHNRDDTPQSCKSNVPAGGSDPDKPYITTWDPQSEMNYCWCDGDNDLSDLDVAAVQKLYGSRG